MSQSPTYDNLLSVFQTAVDGIITISHRGIIEMVNPAASTLFGYSTEEMIGRNVNMLMPEPHKTNHDGYLSNYLRTGKAQIIGIGREVEGMRKNGQRFPFRLSISEVVLNSNDRLFTGVVHDISEIKIAEQKLRELNIHLEEKVRERTEELNDVVNRLLSSNSKLKTEISQRRKAETLLNASREELKQSLAKEIELGTLKSRFLTLASHEFRTPLTTILSSATLIKRYSDAATQEKRLKHIERVQRSVRQLNAILDDFLSVSKLEEGKVKANYEVVNVAEELSLWLTEAEESMPKAGRILLENDRQQPEFSTDKKALRHIASNLVSNAIKYSDPPINVKVIIKGDKHYLQINVIDQGIGIPDQDQGHMYERFFRASNSVNIDGTGLGLHIVKEYVDMLGGEIAFTSKLNKGTNFEIRIPADNGK